MRIGARRALLRTPAVAAGALGLQNSLSAFFELNDSGGNGLVDSTGNVTNLTNNNMVTFGSDTIGGVGTNVATFASASSQSLSHADVAALQVSGVDFTLAMWIKYTSAPNNTRLVSKSTTGFPQNGYSMGTQFTSGQTARFSVVGNGGSSNPDGSTFGGTSTATWYLFVGTYNTTSRVASVSVNGGALNAGGASSTMTGDTAQFNIGVDAGGTNFYNGSMCRVGLWKNRILSAGDITALYNGGSGLSYTAMA